MSVHKWNELSESSRNHMRLLEQQQLNESARGLGTAGKYALDILGDVVQYGISIIRNVVIRPGGPSVDMTGIIPHGSLTGVGNYMHDLNNLLFIFGFGKDFAGLKNILFGFFGDQTTAQISRFIQTAFGSPNGIIDLMEWFTNIQIPGSPGYPGGSAMTFFNFLEIADGQLVIRGWDGSHFNPSNMSGDMNQAQGVFGTLQYIIDGINDNMTPEILEIIEGLIGG